MSKLKSEFHLPELIFISCNYHFHFSLSCIGEEMATHSSILAWRLPGTEEPGGLPSMGLHRVKTRLKRLSSSSSSSSNTMFATVENNEVQFTIYGHCPYFLANNSISTFQSKLSYTAEEWITVGKLRFLSDDVNVLIRFISFLSQFKEICFYSFIIRNKYGFLKKTTTVSNIWANLGNSKTLWTSALKDVVHSTDC